MTMADETKPARKSKGSAKVRRSRVSGIDRTLQILDCLQELNRPCTPYEIAQETSAPLSTIYVIIDDLVSKDLLNRVDNGRIWLGARLYYYGLTYSHSIELLSTATYEMQELAQTTGQTIQICGRDGDKMVVLAMTDGPDHFQVTSRVGSRIPLSWTASGRLLVGHLPYDERLEIFKRSARPSPTGKAATDPVELTEASSAALHKGLSIQAGESDYAVACIAAPILDSEGVCRATISIVAPDSRLDTSSTLFSDEVRAAAHRIERKLGWNRKMRASSSGLRVSTF